MLEARRLRETKRRRCENSRRCPEPLGWWLTLPLLAVAALPAGANPAPWQRSETRAECADFETTRSPFFGETHIHTNYSLDAVINGMTSGPRDAYDFAQGLVSLPLTPGNPTAMQQLARPLDFAAVTDHSEYFGELSICLDPSAEPGYSSSECVAFRGDIGVSTGFNSPGFITFFVPTNTSTPERFDWCTSDPLEPDAACLDRASPVWQDTQDAAEEAYDRTASCTFTSFIGYEWTANTNFSNLHRNVLFRNDVATDLPISYMQAPTVQELWAGLESECLAGLPGCDYLAIPHNSNLSGGTMFDAVNADLSPIDAAQAATRARNEPLVEITQHKGDSECHPLFSSNDELCGYEKLSIGSQLPSIGPIDSGFVRFGLKTGLEQEEQLGVNPLQLGFIGSTDGHNGTAGATREDDFPGHAGNFDASTSRRLSTDNAFGNEANPGGLAVVWAEENSRDALFAAMRRREVYATSGNRPVLRTFAGSYPKKLCDAGSEFAREGYLRGAPMGAEIGASRGGKSPSFAVFAMRDAGIPGSPGNPLQRIQMVKGWVDATGTAQEKVFEVAGDPDNGATVDTTTCQPSGPGFDTLCSVWSDPEFDAGQRAFYYARVVENPSCRWSTYFCNANGIDCSDPGNPGNDPLSDFSGCCDGSFPQTVQERAWSSPHFYRPEAVGRFKARLAYGKNPGEDSLKLVMKIQSVPADFDPSANDLSVSVTDDDEIYSVTIPAGTLVAKVPGAKYQLVDKSGNVGGVRKALFKVNAKGVGTLVLKTIQMDLSNADPTEHMVDAAIQIGTYRSSVSRLWELKGGGLRAR